MRYLEGHNVIVHMVETIGRDEGVNFSVSSPTRAQRIKSFFRSLLCLD